MLGSGTSTVCFALVAMVAACGASSDPTSTRADDDDANGGGAGSPQGGESPADGSGATPTPFPEPSPGQVALDSGDGYFEIRGVSADDIWAVGENVLHWDGTSWEERNPPQAGVWRHVAVGNDGQAWVSDGHEEASDYSESLLYHWTGSEWEQWHLRDVMRDAGVALSDAHRIVKIAADGSGRFWMGSVLPPSSCMANPEFSNWLFDAGEWQRPRFGGDIALDSERRAYLYSPLWLAETVTYELVGRCDAPFSGSSGAITSDGIATLVGNLLDPDQRPGEAASCDLFVLPPSDDFQLGTVLPMPGRGRGSLVALDSELYLVHVDSYRRRAVGEDWEDLGWTLPLRDGWGAAPDDAWFVGPEGIAHWDGNELQLVE